MKTLLQSFLLSLFFIQFASAQSLTPRVVASAGNFVTNGNYSLSYTIGEAVIPTFSTNSYILTQGFQQNNLEPTAVQEISYNDLSVKIYPNPATNNVNVLITSDKNTSDLRVRLFDLLGRSLNIPVANYSNGDQHIFTLNLTNLAAAVYFINVYDIAANTTHTFKLNKVNF